MTRVSVRSIRRNDLAPLRRLVQLYLYDLLRVVTGRRRFFHAHRPTSITAAASSKAIELGSGTD